MSKPEAAMPRIIQPVILCGGSGTRLFPVSRAQWPKQFLSLTSTKSLLQNAALRVAPNHSDSGLTFLPPIIVANADHRFAVAEHMRDIGITPTGLLLEPVARNTAGAVAAAAAFATEHHPNGDVALLVLPSDHVIADLAQFHDAIGKTADAIFGQDYLATFGIEPTTPETGYGYVEIGAPIEGHRGVLKVNSFREKPDRQTAESYLQDGRHLWNSGMFLFSAQTLLAEMDKYAPDIARSARQAVALGNRDLDFLRLDPDSFSAIPSISIDYAVMEHTAQALVTPCSIGWSDVGSFKAVWEVSDKDQSGNAIQGDVWQKDARDNLLIADGGAMIAALGVDNLAVVATDDVILVAHRDRAEDVKALVDDLKAKGRPEAIIHRKVYRPWGSYESLSTGPSYQVKRIIVNPGASISLQKHFKRSEHWVVVEGLALVHLDGVDTPLGPNQSIYIPMGSVHRMTNRGSIPLVLIEVQSGSYLGEDDIVRLEDAYNRT